MGPFDKVPFVQRAIEYILHEKLILIPMGALWVLDTKSKTNLTHNLKLIGICPSFLFKSMKFFIVVFDV